MADEQHLDRVLLELLAGHAEAAADVFVERSRRLARSWTGDADGARLHLPVVRADAGCALRIVDGSHVRAAHVSGAPDERLESLARRLRTGGTTAVRRASPKAHADAESVPADDGSRERFDAAVASASAAAAREPGLSALDVLLVRHERNVHVASSEWGHATSEREWETLTVVVEVRDGGPPARASRGAGGARVEAGPAAEMLVREASDAARRAAHALPLPPGRPEVLVAGGAGGILVHEAVGHALEGDVVARGSSFLSGRVGERVACEALTVADDPTLPDLAGSYERDDEGAPSRRAVLIEDGVLRGVLTDGLRAGFSQPLATGHGRRMSFRDQPLPRMTNTQVVAGTMDPREMIATTRDGLLVTRLERASADPLRGRFQIRVAEGFRVEGGRIGAPVRDVLLVGSSDAFLNGLQAASDAAWDDGCGTCGREGQWVRVAVGQPLLKVAAGVFGVA